MLWWVLFSFPLSSIICLHDVFISNCAALCMSASQLSPPASYRSEFLSHLQPYILFFLSLINTEGSSGAIRTDCIYNVSTVCTAKVFSNKAAIIMAFPVRTLTLSITSGKVSSEQGISKNFPGELFSLVLINRRTGEREFTW